MGSMNTRRGNFFVAIHQYSGCGVVIRPHGFIRILSPVRIGRIYIIRPTYLWRLKVRPKICRPNKLIPMETVLNLKLYLHFWCIRINRMTYNLYHITIPFLLQEFNLYGTVSCTRLPEERIEAFRRSANSSVRAKRTGISVDKD